MPRSIFVDFESNFGNYLSSFSHPKPAKPEEQTHWAGPTKVSESEPVPQSEFQRELDLMEDSYSQAIPEADHSSDEDERRDYSDEEDEEDPRDRFKDIMSGYKSAAGGSQTQADYLMQLMMQQMNGGAGTGSAKKKAKKEKSKGYEMIDTAAKSKAAVEEEKSAQEYYEQFKFDQQVRYFTDFLQAKMQP